MIVVRLALAGVLLAALPLLPTSAHARQMGATVTLTVTLTLNAPVPSTDTFSAFIGASDKPLEVVLCGTGRGEGRVTYCATGAAITQRTPIAATGATPYRFVRFTGPFGAGQRGVTFASGSVTLTRDATIGASYPSYPSAAGTVPVTFRLRLYGAIPARESFGVADSRGGASSENPPLCTSEAPSSARTPGGYACPCVGAGVYTTTVRVPAGAAIRWAFYRVRTAPGGSVQARESFAPGNLRVHQAVVIDAYYTFR